MTKKTIIVILVGIVLGLIVVPSLYRTSYGHGRSSFLGAKSVPSEAAQAYYSTMLPLLVEYATTLDLRYATAEEIKDMQKNLWVAVPKASVLSSGNGIILTENGDRLAFSFWPSMDRSIDPDLQFNGFGVSYQYFEDCWPWQKGRLEAPTLERIARLNQWVREYTRRNPPSFDIGVSSGSWRSLGASSEVSYD